MGVRFLVHLLLKMNSYHAKRKKERKQKEIKKEGKKERTKERKGNKIPAMPDRFAVYLVWW